MHKKTYDDTGDRNLFQAILEADVLCYNCQKKGHKSFECKEPKKARTCYHCNKEGHRKYDCPDRKKDYELAKKERNAAKKAKSANFKTRLCVKFEDKD